MLKFLHTIFLIFVCLFGTFAQQKTQINPVPRSVSNANFRVGCSLFSDPNNFSNGSSFSYNAPTNNNSFLVGSSGANYGCMGSIPNQAWFIITVNTGGNLYFNFTNSNNFDVDAVVWGPLFNNDVANACSATQSSPLTCDYDAARPDLYINNAQAGQKYVMLVTNFSNASTIINISQPTGGSVTYSMVNLPNCSLIPTATLSGTNTTITEGQSANLSLNFTGSSPWYYTLSDGTSGTTYTTPVNLTVYPTASQTFTINSVNNLCGTNGGTGSVGISVTRNTQLRSCFPLDGDAVDSQSGLNTGSLQNGTVATSNRISEANKALQFDGIDDFVNIQTNQLNNNTFAFATWVKLDQLPDVNNPEQVIFSMGSAFDQHYLGVEYTNGNAAWKFSSNGTTVYAGNIVNTNWHLLVGVRTGGQIKIYVDGYLSNTVNTSGAATYDSPLTARIGSSIINNKFFKGKIDDFKLFNGSLIDPEILLLLNYTTCTNVVNDTFLAVQSVSTSVICTGTSFVLRAYSNNLTPDPELNFIAELSNSSGSFTSPTVIGTSQFLPVTVNVPSNITGGNYKVRLRYGGIVSVNSFDIFVNNPATHNITGTIALNDGQSSNLNLNFTGTGPWNYVLSNGLSGVATTSPWVISVTPDQSTNYSISSAQNVCGVSNLNGSGNAIVSVTFTKEFVSCFPFNGNSNDSKGNNTATVLGPLLTESRYGQTNTAYTFDGIDDRIEYTTNLLRKREFTMSAWVLMNSIPGGTQYILSQGEFNTNTFQGLAVSSSGWQFQSYSSSGASIASSSVGLVANQWVQLTAVRTYQSLKLYVNGDLVSTVSNSSLIPFKISDIGRVGASSSSLSNFLNGKVDDVRLYKGALTDDEVFALFANVTDCPEVQNAPIIVVRSVSPTTVCAGNTVSVSYTSTNVGISAGSPLNVLLSDQSGSFSSPTIIGSGSSSPITATIPIGIPSSAFYRIRLVSTGVTPVNSANTRTINVSGSLPTASLSGGGSIQFGQNATLTLNFTGTAPWTFALNNGSTQTASSNPHSISISPFATTNYSITSLSNSCGSGTGSGTATVTVAPYIGLGALSNTALCTGTNFSVSYQANFTPSNNTFRVELSDVSGNFTNPVNIGTGSSSPITAQIPNTDASGTGYRVRVVSDNPATQSAVSSALTVTQRATATISGGTTINEGQSANLTINFTGQAPWTYALNNGTSQTTNSNPLIISVIPLTTTTYTITSLSNSCGGGTVSGSAVITVNPVPIRLVSCFPFNGNANDGKGLNNGTVYGATLTTDRFGTANSSYSYDGNSNYIESNPINSITNPQYTYSAWIWASSSMVNGAISPIIDIGGQVIFLNKINNGFTISYSGDNNFTNRTYSLSSFVTEQWYNICFVRYSGGFTLYINGVQIGNDIITGMFQTAGYFSNSVLKIGKYGIYSFNGKIDDVQIYKGALTDGQIQAVYNSNDGCFDASLVSVLSLNSLSSTTFCRNQSVTIPFSAANITNPIKVQLSDASGSFASPIEIGLGNSSPISVTIPANQATGTGYKIRLVSSDAVPVVSNLSANLTINAPVTATISGTVIINEGQSTNLAINLSGTAPYTYIITGGTSQTTSLSSVSIPVNPLTNTTYQITSLSNTCGTSTGTGSAIITVNPVPIRLVSCFPFNGNANDGKGLNNGTVYGATLSTDRFGNPSSSYNFDGTSNAIVFPTNGLLNHEFSYSIWLNIPNVKVQAMPNDYLLFQMGTAYSSKLMVYLDYLPNMGFGPEQFNINIILNGISQRILVPNMTFATWNNLTIVKTSNGLALYFNGLNVLSNFGSNANINFENNPQIFIGALNYYSNTLAFYGKIDDIQIYKGALTAGQVQALYNSNDSCFDATLVSVLSLNSLPSTSFCRNQSLSIPFSSANTTNPISVQLSDANGSFDSPIEIGSGSTSPISAQIPINQATGTGYKIRLVSSDLIPVVSNLSANISINARVTATISGTTTITEGQSTNLTINFAGSAPYTYTITGGTSQTTSLSSVSIPVSPLTNTTFQITSISNACGTAIGTGSAVISVNPVPTRLVSCFPFNGNANDSKELNNGTVYGATLTNDRFGNTNSAYNFDGNDDYIEFPANQLENNQFTFSVWANPASSPGAVNRFLLNVGGQMYNQSLSFLFGGPNDSWGFRVIDGNFNVYTANTNPLNQINLNNWYHIVGVRENLHIKLYVNGTPILAIPTSSSLTNYRSANQGEQVFGRIGVLRSEATMTYFNGNIDDVQIYKGALTAEQVLSLYQNTNPCFDATAPPCLTDNLFNSMLSGQQTLQVSNQIIGRNSIQTGANIHFDSKNSVILEPGFKTEANTIFRATVGGGCN